jgi:hypothetical protein
MSGYQAAVGTAFKGLANRYRILAPRTSAAFKPGGAQANYLKAVIDQVWNFYTTHSWTENDHGVVYTGHVVNGVLTGTRNDQGGTDLIRAVGRGFCAAFHRGVALNTAAWFDPTKYYQSNPKDDYAAYFHSVSLGHRSYAFAYDDVNDQSSVQILNNSNPPDNLTLGIGW